MTYRNGKCYDSYGNEMSTSQINQMYKASQDYIRQLNESKNEELSRDEMIEKLSSNVNFVLK